MAGCDEFSTCLDEWQVCMQECPSAAQEQAAIDQVEAQYDACIAACPVLDPSAPEADQLAAGRCIKACIDARAEGLDAATACSDTCDEAFATCVGELNVCNDPTDPTYLMQVQVADWAPHHSQSLNDPNHGVFLCEDHFPAGTAQGDAVEAAVNAFSSIPGTTLDMFALRQPHEDKSGLFAEPATFSSFDYVDNVNDPFIHPCHPDNPTACGDTATVDGFTINMCPHRGGAWNGAGATDFFAITANASCYDYFSDPTSSDHVEKPGALHELGHAIGMKHRAFWPTADWQYISTMQGGLEHLSAYDVAFMREFYPEAYNLPWRNFVASSKIRIDFAGPNEVKGSFGGVNPTGVYLVGDRVFDCATHQEAEWFAAWFNTGLSDQAADHCMVNELRIEDPHTRADAVLHRWHAAPMPAESQDHWRGDASSVASDFFGVRRDVELELVFEVNVFEQWREPDEDNEVRAPITVYSSSTCSAASPPPPPLPPVRLLSSGAYEVAEVFVDYLSNAPRKLLRGASLAPSRVAQQQGLGFELFRLEEGSIGAALGLKEGDILWRVEGNPITGPQTALDAVNHLKTAGELDLVVVRDQGFVSLKYLLR